MNKIIHKNKDELTMKYIIVTLFSLLTLKKLKRVEKYKMELKAEKERQNQENDFDKI